MHRSTGVRLPDSGRITGQPEVTTKTGVSGLATIAPEPLFKVEPSLDEWLGPLNNGGFFDFALFEIPDRSQNCRRGLLGRRSQQTIDDALTNDVTGVTVLL